MRGSNQFATKALGKNQMSFMYGTQSAEVKSHGENFAYIKGAFY